MELKFLGRGAAFYPAFGNTNAFFAQSEDLFFLDFGEAAFEKAVPEEGFTAALDTRYEEFFFRWGVAALFHDVGYPVEIVGHQINRFIRMVADADGDEIKVKAQIRYENFHELNHIREVVPKRRFTRAFYDAYESCSYIDLLTPLDLISHRIHRCFGTELEQTKAALGRFLEDMAKSGFIDHGYYSSLIILKWYGYAMQRAKEDPRRFFWPPWAREPRRVSMSARTATSGPRTRPSWPSWTIGRTSNSVFSCTGACTACPAS